MEGLIPMVYKALIKKNRKRGRKAYECPSSGAARTFGFYTRDGDDDLMLMPQGTDSSPPAACGQQPSF
ncbi:hypothetical protein OROGR_016266 [Orobanche gracilis]